MHLIIGVWGGDNRIYASYKFFLYTLLGSVLMLIAMFWMVDTAGSNRHPNADAYDFDPDEQGAMMSRQCGRELRAGADLGPVVARAQGFQMRTFEAADCGFCNFGRRSFEAWRIRFHSF